MQSLII